MKQAKDYWTPVFEHYASHYPNYAERTVVSEWTDGNHGKIR